MIGTDIIDKRRIAALWHTHGWRLAEKILHPAERARLGEARDPVRYLAMRWAAKEALGKALGTGLRAPLVMPAIRLDKTALGAPQFADTEPLRSLRLARGIATIHLSLSDERDYAVAFVWCERQTRARSKP